MNTRISFTGEEIKYLIEAASIYAGQEGWDETYKNILKKLDKGSERVGGDEELKKLVPDKVRKVLEEERILDKYIHNIKACNLPVGWRHCAKCDSIAGAFIWGHTKEGHDYWNNIFNKIS